MMKDKPGKIQAMSPSVKAFCFFSPVLCLVFVPGKALTSLEFLTGLGGQGIFMSRPLTITYGAGRVDYFFKVYCFKSNLIFYIKFCLA